MSATPSQSAAVPAAPQAFRRRVDGVSYEVIAPLRDELKQFLESSGAGREETGRFLLTLTEIITNLAKHPPQKATFADVIAEKGADGIRLTVADDSTPFAAFEEKCESARRRDPCPCGKEDGYGLFCILRQHLEISYIPAGQSADGLNRFSVAGSAPPSGARRKVFLVDDDSIALKIESRMLESAYDVTTFSSAEAALKAFAAAKPDLVISDLVMPGMDGTELRRALTELPLGKETPFVFLSGMSERQHTPYINSLGIDDFILKPAKAEHLLSVAARLLRRSEQIRTAVHEKMSVEITGLLKPTLPAAWKEWRFHVTTAAAEAGGGDFVLHHAGDDRLLAVIADVMGHGHTAKFFSYAYAGYLRSLLNMQQDHDPAQFLERLSACTRGDDFLENTVMTCQAVQLFDYGRVRIASAGHPAPVRVGKTGAVPLEVAGPLPGMIGDSRYNAKELTLAPGERLILATDGFFDAFDGAAFRHEDLIPLLQDSSALSAAALSSRLWDAYAAKAAGRARDDATLVIIAYGE